MTRLAIGFLAGVVATFALLALVGKGPLGGDSAPPGPVNTVDTQSGGTGQGSNAPEVSAGGVAGESDTTAARQAGRVAGDELPAAASGAGAPVLPRADGGAAIENLTLPAPTARSLDNRRSYPPEINNMIENRVDKMLHARYEADEREESWATYMEGQLAAYFGGKAELAAFSFSLIDCRTTLCEIHALGYGPDALTVWNTATADIVNQSWHDFNRMSLDRFNPQPDVLGIVLIFERNPG